jgi:hypothetical protein
LDQAEQILLPLALPHWVVVVVDQGLLERLVDLVVAAGIQTPQAALELLDKGQAVEMAAEPMELRRFVAEAEAVRLKWA